MHRAAWRSARGSCTAGLQSVDMVHASMTVQLHHRLSDTAVVGRAPTFIEGGHVHLARAPVLPPCAASVRDTASEPLHVQPAAVCMHVWASQASKLL